MNFLSLRTERLHTFFIVLPGSGAAVLVHNACVPNFGARGNAAIGNWGVHQYAPRVIGAAQAVGGAIGTAACVGGLVGDPEPVTKGVCALGIPAGLEVTNDGLDQMIHGENAQPSNAVANGVSSVARAAGAGPNTANTIGAAASGISRGCFIAGPSIANPVSGPTLLNGEPSPQIGPSGRPTFRAPAARHTLGRVNQSTLAKDANTVVDPSVDVAADVTAINQGIADRVGNTFVINGRTYGMHDGTLYPISGPGFYQLNRGAFQALGVLQKFGDTPQAASILARMKNVGQAEIEAAKAAWRAGQ